jgi:hypothetical protein
MRDYRKTQRRKLEERAYKRGVEAMREASTKVFLSAAACEFNGKAVAGVLGTVQVPRLT